MRFSTAASLVTLVLLSSCGGSDDRDGGPDRAQCDATGAPSKVEFIAQADELCTDFRRETKGLQSADLDSPPELERFANRTADVTAEWLAKFRRLTPPKGDEEVIDSYLSSIEESIALFRM